MTTLQAAIQEAYACATTNVVVLETIEISNPGLPDSVFLVKDLVDHSMNLETGELVTFKAMPFKLVLPKMDADGLQELSITVDNVDRSVSEYLRLVKSLPTPTKVKYRPYLSTDKSTPQMNPPLTLYVVDSSVTTFEVRMRASFLNYLNKKFPTPNQYYTRGRFPSLGQ